MKTVHDKLVIKVNAIDTSEFVLKTHLQIRSRKKNDDAGKKYLILMGCKKNPDHNAKISDKIPGKIPSISGLASTVENKIKIKYPTLMA